MYPNDYRFLQMHLGAPHAKVRDKPSRGDSGAARSRSIFETAVEAMPLIAIVFVIAALVLWQIP
jgi:hypothetical protein